nr:cell envelope integrity protein TolA [Lysobacter sp. GX 14042]
MAVVLHLVLFGLMFIGLWWTRAPETVSAAGSPVEAKLVDANALSAAMRQTLSERPDPVPLPEPEPEPEPEPVAPLPQPEPEPRPQDAPAPPQQAPQESIPEPDPVEQDEVVAEPTPTPAEENARLQEEKRRQEQIDLTERKRQEEAEQKRRRAEQQAERERKLAEIRSEREKAERERKLLEQKARQLAEAREAADTATGSASPPPGNQGDDTGLRARYAAALTEAIRAKWTRPETVPIGARCTLVIRQLPGGEVMSVDVGNPCSYDEQGRRSIEAAVLKAQPLPYSGFEKVFARELRLNFVAQD